MVSDDGRTAFVTGGSGFIGGRLIKRLVADGWRVRALARSDGAAEKVSRAGRRAGARRPRGPRRDARRRRGRRRRLPRRRAPRRVGRPGGVRAHQRGRHPQRDRGSPRRGRAPASCTSAPRPACWPGEPLVNVNEDAPLRPDSKALYSATKAMAEQVVRDANGDGFETVVVRPRLVWGAGDTTILPASSSAVEKKRFSWIGGGGHRTSTTHVDNVIEGLMLGAERGPARRRLLRHRRRAGRLPRVRHRAARDAGRRRRPTATCRRRVGARRGRGLGGHLAPSAPARQPAGHAPRLLALGAGVHDRHLARARRSSATSRCARGPRAWRSCGASTPRAS